MQRREEMIEVVYMHLLCIYAVLEEVGEEDKYVQAPMRWLELFRDFFLVHRL